MTAQFVRLPSGREVLDTGKVQIGIRAQAPTRDIGVHAEHIQGVLIASARHSVTDLGHRAVVLFCCIGIVGVVGAIVIGWLQ
jgi:hypothetical protein